MFKYLLITLFLIASVAASGQADKKGVIYDVEILRVIDGDTVAYQAPFLPDPLKKELSIRIYGVDTPEKSFRAKCESEAKRGEVATEFTKKLVERAKKKQIVLMEWDKYGGRVLGDIVLDGKSLRKLLIDKGYAREYYGEAKQSWCN